MSSTDVVVTAQKLGILHVDNVSTESVNEVNKYLQHNHENFHILWNVERNLHNHQVHYLLTDLALGASPDQIRRAFETNTGYQRSFQAGDESHQRVNTDENWAAAIGQADYYASWIRYFSGEIALKGWQTVLIESLFARTARADDLFGRMYEGETCLSGVAVGERVLTVWPGALHPIIHLGFGVEFEQPAIIAEALAQAAVHPVGGARYLLRVEELAKSSPIWTVRDELTSLFLKARANPVIKDADCWKPGSYERDGDVFDVAPPALVDLAATYRLDRGMSEDLLHEHIAEMINVVAWFTCAAQRSDKQPKFDFFLIHAVNCSIFLSVFANLPWLNLDAKIRLLEFKTRVDLVLYVTQGCPELRVEEISQYEIRRPKCTTWEAVIERAKAIPCDGHVVKMIRALNHGAIVCRKYHEETWPIKGFMWIKMANMVLDSTEDHPGVLEKWMRGPGFDKAWDVVPDRITP
ncbi:hypothetical protein H2200_005941 [Cladophialophora chaetospira]|uniref:Oxidoreductase AflY n=1 Tax=Cladophialophora chaetospira TaxID=386627 RepID=A0AA39CI29_9EURO|nr:hypothetical protein H2200_005941 [Cladophialophora chaetospira]